MIPKRTDVNPKEGIEKYGEVKFADEKNHKYPIDTPEHIRAALRYWGKDSNREEYSKGRMAIGNKIKAAARRHGIS